MRTTLLLKGKSKKNNRGFIYSVLKYKYALFTCLRPNKTSLISLKQYICRQIGKTNWLNRNKQQLVSFMSSRLDSFCLFYSRKVNRACLNLECVGSFSSAHIRKQTNL